MGLREMFSYSFDLCAVSELLDSVTVLCVVLQQDGHLEGGGLQCVPVNNNNNRFSMKPTQTARPGPHSCSLAQESDKHTS